MTIHDLAKLSKNEMEALFKKSLWRSRVFTLLTILWAAFCIWLYCTTSNSALKISIFTFFCIALLLWFIVFYMQILSLRMSSVKLSRIKKTQIGKYSVNEIRMIIDKVFSKSLAREKPEIFIIESNHINAFTLNIYLFNFVKFANAIYISKKCFNCLDEGEIEVLILHEMGHFNRYEYSEKKLLNFGLFLYLFMPFAFTVLFPGILLRICFLFFCFIFIVMLYTVIRKKKDYESHLTEYLSDLYAAERTSKLSFLNLIITAARESAVVREKDKERMLKQIFLPIKRTVVDWSAFDTHLINGKIEIEEYDNLINTLKSIENPQMIKDSITDHNSNSHPSLTNRVLFIHHNIAD